MQCFHICFGCCLYFPNENIPPSLPLPAATLPGGGGSRCIDGSLITGRGRVWRKAGLLPLDYRGSGAARSGLRAFQDYHHFHRSGQRAFQDSHHFHRSGLRALQDSHHFHRSEIRVWFKPDCGPPLHWLIRQTYWLNGYNWTPSVHWQWPFCKHKPVNLNIR